MSSGDSATSSARVWRIRGGSLALDRPIVVGIINVTPDSFSDGGRFLAPDDAEAQALRLAAEGADLLDIGGESTRPQGAMPVDAGEEIRRVLPVIERVRKVLPRMPISVDTNKHEVALAALGAGAAVVNDVSALRLDPRLARVVADYEAGLVLMHSRGGVSDMATFAHARYDDVAAEIVEELDAATTAARNAGIAPAAIAVDPGIGFAKRREHSLAAVAAVPRLAELGFPIMVGVSRKRFIGELTGEAHAPQRLFGTVGANVAALMLGARIFRVHDVRANRQALDVAWAVAQAGHTGAVEAGS
jgi:dihydropteroate synthase